MLFGAKGNEACAPQLLKPVHCRARSATGDATAMRRPCAATKESLHGATQTQHSQKLTFFFFFKYIEVLDARI